MSAPNHSSGGSPISVGEGYRGVELPVDRRLDDLRDRVAAWRGADEGVALVPTMGKLHAGHDLLIRAARQVAQRVVAALIPGPTVSAAGADTLVEPASEIADLRRLSEVGADSCWAPGPARMLPPGVETRIRPGALADCMEGVHRREAFEWVATAVTKLLLQVEPDVVVFADRDYQLLLIVARIAADLDLPVQVATAATARESDGLAVSGGNARLGSEARTVAPTLPKTLMRMARRLADGASTPEAEIAWGRDQLTEVGITTIDYLDVRDPRTLEPVTTSGTPARVFAAVRLDGVRLVDSIAAT